MPRPWRETARPKQIPPDSDWLVYLVTVGRGWGKSWAASNWLAEQAVTRPNTNWAVIAPTWRDVRVISFEGRSGILRALQPGELESFNHADLTATLRNGSRIRGYTLSGADRLAESPECFDGVWIDELDLSADDELYYPAVDVAEAWNDWILPSLTDSPKVYITTAPPSKPSALMQHLLSLSSEGHVVHVRGSAWENAANLSKAALERLRRLGYTSAAELLYCDL